MGGLEPLAGLVEAEGFEPSSRDFFDGGLYMLRRFFDLDAGDENRHPSPASSRLDLISAPTSERGNQSTVLSLSVADIRKVPSSLN